jgi:hypothetical protein
VTRTPIRFSKPGRLMALVGLLPSRSWIELGDGELHVRMGWAFDLRVPTESVDSASPCDRSFISRGVHGWRGRWLVNGSGEGLVTVRFEPRQRGRSGPFAVWVQELIVSVDDPGAFLAALDAARTAPSPGRHVV